MTNYFLVVSLLFSICFTSLGQDIITTQEGTEIEAKVLQISKNGIRYQRFDDPEFALHRLPYDRLARIKYGETKRTIHFNHRLPRSFVALSGGLSLPMGSFAGKDFNAANEPGFARTGLNIRLEAGIYLYKKWGLSLSAGYAAFKFDEQRYVSSILNTYSLQNTAAKYWTMPHLMAGPMYSFKAAQRITIDLKARAGLIVTQKPAVEFSYLGQNDYPNSNVLFDSLQFDYRKGQALRAGFNFGAGIRYALGKRWALTLTADYMRTTPDIEFEVHIQDLVHATATHKPITVRYHLSSLHFNGGIVYLFKRKGNYYE
jgi:hypothetical protein